MRYGKITEKGVLVRDFPNEGYKPIEESEPENRQGFYAVFHYEESGEKIMMVWDYIELSDEEKAEVER